MKKRIFLLFALFLPLYLSAENVHTDDQITVSDVTVIPGGSYAIVTVSLSGSRAYTAYSIDAIQLPLGLSVYYSGAEPMIAPDKGMWPYTTDFFSSEKTYSHSFTSSYGVAGARTLRVECHSSNNSSFTANSGAFFRFAVVASPYMKPGTADITISGIKLVSMISGVQGDWVPDNVTKSITVSDQSTVSLNISAANQYSTVVLPFDAAIPSGVTAYAPASVSEGYVYVEEASSFSAYTPYIVYAENGYTGTLSGTVDPNAYPASGIANESGILRGAIVPQSVTEGYVLQNLNNTGVKFHRINSASAIAIPEGKCWLVAPSTAGASLRFGTEMPIPEGIENTEFGIDPTAPIYDLQGRQVTNPVSRQMYIQNGKRYIKL